jgi:hypothetical protein
MILIILSDSEIAFAEVTQGKIDKYMFLIYALAQKACVNNSELFARYRPCIAVSGSGPEFYLRLCDLVARAYAEKILRNASAGLAILGGFKLKSGAIVAAPENVSTAPPFSLARALAAIDMTREAAATDNGMVDSGGLMCFLAALDFAQLHASPEEAAIHYTEARRHRDHIAGGGALHVPVVFSGARRNAQSDESGCYRFGKGMIYIPSIPVVPVNSAFSALSARVVSAAIDHPIPCVDQTIPHDIDPFAFFISRTAHSIEYVRN